MGIFAQSNRTALILRAEQQWGEVPVPGAGNPWQTRRFTSESLDLDKKTTRSETIRADRMSDGLLYVGRSVAGDVSAELAYGELDDLMAGAVGGAWKVGGSKSGTVATEIGVTIAWNAVNKTGTATLAAGTWLALGVIPNIILAMKGFTNAVNNGNYYITAVNGASFTYVPANGVIPVAEVAASGIQYHYEYLTNGVQTPSFCAEKQFLDINAFAYYSGLYVDTMSVDLSAQEIIKIQFTMMGKDNVVSDGTDYATSVSTGSTVNAALTTNSMTASVNIGLLLVDGAPVSTGVKSLKFDTANNLRMQDVIGSATPAGFGYGEFNVKGTTEAYFEDTSLWLKIVSHENVSQFSSIKDLDGNEISFGIPLSNFDKGAGKVGGKNQDVMLPLEWEASRDPLSNAELIVSRMPKPALIDWTLLAS